MKRIHRWFCTAPFRQFLIVLGVGCGFGLHPALSFAGQDAGPCAAAEHHQLDFWLGDWVISAPGGTGGSTSTVSLSLDQCVVVERWGDGKDHQGENLFGFSADDRSWHGFFADNRGRVHVFVNGKVASGVAEFRGPSTAEDGRAVVNRVRIILDHPNKVEQIWEKSTDNGTTWTTAFRGEYVRRNP
jgi:hypothetical protein